MTRRGLFGLIAGAIVGRKAAKALPQVPALHMKNGAIIHLGGLERINSGPVPRYVVYMGGRGDGKTWALYSKLIAEQRAEAGLTFPPYPVFDPKVRHFE
jgi:hypothetical protein